MSYVVLLIAIAVSCAGTFGLIHLLRRWNVLDVPNARSAHAAPTPRGGGAAIVLGIACGLAAASFAGLPLPPTPILLATAVIATVGLLDDGLGGIPVPLRFGAQTAAASFVVWQLGPVDRMPLPSPLDFNLGPLGFSVSVFWILAVCNIYNFLDGMDGYAGAQGVVAGMGFALLPHPQLHALGISATGACVGFLVFNWWPARIFMGDTGSLSLGFLFGCAPFAVDPGSRPEALFATAIFLWFFLADGTFTLLRRLFHGEAIWQAHCSHVYQRLLHSGVRVERLVVIAMTMTTVLALTVVALLRPGTLVLDRLMHWLVLCAATLTFILALRWCALRSSRMVPEAQGSAVKSRLKAQSASPGA